MNYVSRWVLEWAYQHGLNGMRFNEFYEERNIYKLLGIKIIMDAWVKGHDDRRQLG